MAITGDMLPERVWFSRLSSRVSLYGIVIIGECFGRGDFRIIFKSIIDRFRIAFEANVRFAFMFSCENKYRDENVANNFSREF